MCTYHEVKSTMLCLCLIGNEAHDAGGEVHLRHCDVFYFDICIRPYNVTLISAKRTL